MKSRGNIWKIAVAYQYIDPHPIAGALGAEVRGVDLSHPVAPEVFAEIRAAWGEHLVLFFRDQPLTVEQLETLTLQFGAFGDDPFIAPMAGHPHVIELIREAHETSPAFGNGWHSDWSFQQTPPSATLLHAQEVPEHGGDTLFTNMYLAYEALSDGMKELLSGLTAIHSAAMPYGPNGFYGRENAERGIKILPSEKALETVEHPLVRTHGDTGRKCLYVNPVYTVGLKNMHRDESAPILKFLCEHSVQPAFTCRFRWRANSLAIWDNRCTQHMALSDYQGVRRAMHRTTVRGERPVV